MIEVALVNLGIAALNLTALAFTGYWWSALCGGIALGIAFCASYEWWYIERDERKAAA